MLRHSQLNVEPVSVSGTEQRIGLAIKRADLAIERGNRCRCCKGCNVGSGTKRNAAVRRHDTDRTGLGSGSGGKVPTITELPVPPILT